MILEVAFKCTSFENFVADMLEFSDSWGFTGWTRDERGNRTYPKNGATFTSKARLDWSWIPVLYDPRKIVEYTGLDPDPVVIQEGVDQEPHVNLRLSGTLSEFMPAFNSRKGGLSKEAITSKNGRDYKWTVMTNGTRLLTLEKSGRSDLHFPLTPRRTWYI